LTIVVDASVALRWFVETEGADEALGLLQSEDPLIAPELVVAEVSNAAWKLVRAKEIDRNHGARIVAAVSSSFSNLVSTPRLASRAFRVALELGHPIYDCLYLSLADLEDCVLVTADRRLMRRVEQTRWADRVSNLFVNSS